MPKIKKDPIDAIRVYLPKNGGISFSRSTGAAVRRRADSLPRPRVLCPGDGFAVYVFSNRQRFHGFWEAIPFFTDDNDRLSQACATDLPGKLCGIAVRGRYDDVQQWVDLRSKRAGK